jgi:tRNA G10  N-methylase Trm11
LVYKYYKNQNFEDFACGRVIFGRAGFTNYPVKIAYEMFNRALEYSERKENITVFDPCCGGGYLLTVLGFLNPDQISRIIASDVSADAVSLAENNLSLLSEVGLMKRKQQIEEMLVKFNKQSHREALKSVDVFHNIIKKRKRSPEITCFTADVLDSRQFEGRDFSADILITDVPYGDLVSWSEEDDSLNRFLTNIIPVLHDNSILVISTDKSQKIKNECFHRLERFSIGKRLISILQLVV